MIIPTEGTIIRVHVTASPSGICVVAGVLFDGCPPRHGGDSSHGLMAVLNDPTAGMDMYALTVRLLGTQEAEAGTPLGSLEGRRIRAVLDATCIYIHWNNVEVLPVPTPDAPTPTLLNWQPVTALPATWRDLEASKRKMVFAWDGGIYNGWPLPASLNGNDDGSVWETDEHAHKLGGVLWWAYCPLDAVPPSTSRAIPAHFLR